MKSYLLTLTVALGVTLSVGSVRGGQFDEIVRPFLNQYCIECHHAGDRKGGLSFSEFQTEAEFRQFPDILDITKWVMEEGEMPPKTAKAHPDEELLARVLAIMDETLLSILNAAPNDPGLVIMPRINHREYQRVVQSLTGTDINVAFFLPVDGAAGEGFLNVGQSHQMPVEQFEAFLGAAKALTEYAIPSPTLGLNWMPLPYPTIANRSLMLEELRRMHGEALDRLLIPIYDAHMRFVRQNGNIAIYFEAVWRYKHRAALGFGANATFEDISKSFSRPLFPGSIERIWNLVNWETYPPMPNPPWTPAGGEVGSDYHYHALDRGAAPHEFVKQNHLLRMIIADWHELPAPKNKEDLELGTKLNRELWSRWNETLRGRNTFPNFNSGRRVAAEVREQDFMGAFAGNKNYRIDLSKVDGDYIYLAVSDAYDPGPEDIMIWAEGRVVTFDGDGPGVETPWQEVFTEVTDALRDNQPVAFGSHPLGASVAPHTIGVHAPSVLRIRIPESAKNAELHVQMKLCPDHGMNASCQSVITDDIPENLHWFPGRRIVGKLASHRGALADGSMAMIGNWNDFRYKGFASVSDEERRVLLRNVKYAAQFSFLNEEQARNLGLQWPLEYDNAFYPGWIQAFNWPEEYVPWMTEEQKREFDHLNALIVSLSSSAETDLYYAVRAAGIEEPARGLFPSVEQYQKLRPDVQTHLQQLAQAYMAQAQNERPAAEQQLAKFMRQAWRGQVTQEDVNNIMEFYDRDRTNGKPFFVAVRNAMVPVLVHPKFLYRFTPATNEEVVALTPHALASRLSFMLWGTLPDEELLTLAESGEILKPEVLRAQVDRMLQDDRSDAMASEFAGLWLQFADFRTAVNPDPVRFPQFTDELKDAMEREPIEFFTYIFRENQPITDAILGDYTFLNETLAKHYGVTGVSGNQMRKVSMDDGKRGGILGMGSLLTKNAESLRTSPIKRGHWVYEKVLGIHMPPPPPNVPLLSDDERNEEGLSVREQLEMHRDNPACFSCHDRFDPLGIAMENFDAIGGWREKDFSGEPVDSSGLFVSSGRVLNGIEGLREYLQENKDTFVKGFSKKLLGYAIGRPVEVTDQPLLDAMTEALKANDYRPSEAIKILVVSPQFLNIRNQDPGASTAAVY